MTRETGLHDSEEDGETQATFTPSELELNETRYENG